MDESEEQKRFRIGKEVAEQLWREQQLTNCRMTWNLTFQSFMLAAFVVTFAQKIYPVWALSLRLCLCLAGLFVAMVTRSSVNASHDQRDYLKLVWKNLYPVKDFFGYPRPFADAQASVMGRRAPSKILLTLICLWRVFAILGLVVFCMLL